MEKLLYSPEEARHILGDIGEKAFRALGVPAKRVGKRKKYRLCDLQAFINNLPTEQPCQSTKGRGRRSGNTTSQSKDKDFAEVRKHLIEQRRSHLKRENETGLSLVIGANHA
jgi:hypothetical protein